MPSQSGGHNSEARVANGQVQIDVDGNGTADILINLTGLANASQLVSADFLWS